MPDALPGAQAGKAGEEGLVTTFPAFGVGVAEYQFGKRQKREGVRRFGSFLVTMAQVL